MNRVKNLSIAVILVLALSVLYTSPVLSQEKRYGGTLRIVINSDPRPDLNPVLTADDVSNAIGNNIFNKLVELDKDFNVQPDLADSWEISADGLTYTFHLHPGVKWHDGKPFTSEDVKYTLENAMKIGAAASRLIDIKSMETPNVNTIVIGLKKPVAPFPVVLAWGCTHILPKHLYEGTDWTKNPYNEKPVGTGPFKFVEWKRGDHITLEANREYFKGSPYLTKVIFKIIPDIRTATAALLTGEVDALSMYSSPAYKDVPKLATTEGLYALVWKYYTYWRLAFKLDHPIFSKYKVRAAIAHAIDRDKIVSVAYSGVPEAAATASPLSSVVAWAYNPNCTNYAFNPAKAEALLDEAGYPRMADGWRFSATIDFITMYPGDEDMWLLIKSMLENVGIKTTLVKLDTASYLSKVWTVHDFEMAFAGGGTGPDPDNLRFFYRTGGSGNFYGYSNLQVDEWLDKAAETAEKTKRTEYYFKIQETIANELPSIPIWNIVIVEAWKKEFVGREKIGLFFADLANIWWEKGNLPPLVEAKIIAPSEGYYLFKGVNVQLSGTGKPDPANFASMELLVDEKAVQVWKEAGTKTYSLDTTTLKDGTHTLKLKVHDVIGYTAQQTVTVVVDNTPPSVSITSPSDKATLSGSVSITFSVVEPNVKESKLLIGPAEKDVTGLTSYKWDTTTYVDGTYTITLTATDKAGNAASKSITVATSNGIIPYNPTPWYVAGGLGIAFILAVVYITYLKRKK